MKQSGSHNTHAKLSPSSSARWLQCTASVSFIEKLKAVDEGNRYADEGTEAHDYATKVLLGEMRIEEVPKDFRPHIAFYVDHCLELVPEGVRPHIELKVPLWYRVKGTEDSGTFDFGFATDDLVVFRDLKYGYKLVRAFENTQLAIYAMSYMRDLEEDGLADFHPDTIVDMGIVQPRGSDDDMVRTWKITYKELIDFCATIEETARDIQQGRNLVFVPSDKACEWCPVKHKCVKRAESVASVFDGPDRKGLDVLAAFAALDAPTHAAPEDRAQARLDQIEQETGLCFDGLMTDDFLILLLQAEDHFKAFIKDIWEHVEKRTFDGDTFGGKTMITLGKLGNRAWTDEGEVAKLLRTQGGLSRDDVYDVSIVGPATIDKLLPVKKRTPELDAALKSYIHRSPAKKVMALADPKKNKKPVATALSAFAAATAAEDPYGEL